jgi:hypothetical protein
MRDPGKTPRADAPVLTGLACDFCPRGVVSQEASLTLLISKRTIMVMAKRQVVTITDDINGREGAETVTFA